MYHCSHCDEAFPTSAPTHLRNCLSYKVFVDNVEKIMTEEFLEAEYVVAGRSAAHIAASLGLAKTRLVLKKLKEHGFAIRSDPREFSSQPHRQALVRERSLEKYGVDHHLKHPGVIAKRGETVKERYGVSNVFQNEMVKSTIHDTCLKRYGNRHAIRSSQVVKKVQETNLERFGYDNPWKCPNIQKKIRDRRAQSDNPPVFYSKQSQKFFWSLYEVLPEYLKNGVYFAELNKEFGSACGDFYYFYDFAILSLQFCVEYNGTYYHADPRIYEASYVNKKLGLTASQIWAKDKAKTSALEERGFYVHVVWQRDDPQHSLEQVLALIKARVSLYQIQSNE